MDNNITLKVQQLKSAFSVEGVPLIKSDRFTFDEIKEMKSKSDAHSSHWDIHMPSAKTWTDEEIATQLEVFFATPSIEEVKFNGMVDSMLKKLPIVNYEEERNAFKQELFKVLNWTEEKNGLCDMWLPFGSAPYVISNNKKLVEAANKYGAVGINVILGTEFSNKFHLFWYSVSNALHHFESFWKEAKAKKELKSTIFTSPYNSLDEIEDNVVVKKIPEAAKAFYLDKTKDFYERVKVFSKHGEFDSSIFEPSDSDLKKIFKIYHENDIVRNQNIDSVDVIWYWVDYLAYKRCHLDWSNQYHPKIKAKKRNYKPSEEASERLYRYYVEKLFLEGIGSYEFDW
jgi:hypothetical protein